jgi:hypothetical protein
MRVIEDLFHAVAVAAVAGYTREIASDLEVAICAAGGLKAGMGLGKALADFAASRVAEGFIRPPSARGKALRARTKIETVTRGAKMLLAA